MPTTNFTGWTNAELGLLPPAEDDRYEYKSSRTPFDQIAVKLDRAASGFWNSGGGVFVAGVGNDGKPDGGIAATVGRQSLRDWVDRVLSKVEPAGPYDVQMMPGAGAGGIDQGHVVLVVQFAESNQPPHMASDGRYYIRAGAHTDPARHFVVEALTARRAYRAPLIRPAYRLKPGAEQVLQLGLVAYNDVLAVNVELALDPLPEMWKTAANPFPLRIPAIDRHNPFYMDLSPWTLAGDRVGSQSRVILAYENQSGYKYSHEESLDPVPALSPWKVGEAADEALVKRIERLTTAIDNLARRTRG